MKLTLIRHTSLQIAAGICYGQSDVDVAHSFFDEVETLKTKLNTKHSHTTLNAKHFDAIYSSPLQRCTKLAIALQSSLNVDSHTVHEHLKELDFGDWELQAWDDISRDIFDVWAKDYASLAPPNGETFSQLQQRGLQFLTQMQTKHAGEHIVVITHGGMIRALIANVLNMELKGLFRITIDYASMTQLDFSQAVPKINFVNL